MRQITERIVRAFEGRYEFRIDNSYTDGQGLWLHGNKIAMWDGNLWITNAGWESRVTKERLNGLSGVRISVRRGVWFLNGREWNGAWTNVWNWDVYGGRQYEPECQAVANEPEFDTTSEWMPEGYSRPVYSVFHALVESELEAVEALLTEAGIPTKRMESDTQGVYRPNYFIVVRPDDVVKAINILTNNLN